MTARFFPAISRPRAKREKSSPSASRLTAISAITPFNHPLNMVAHKIAPAVATNNCMVVKPTELTPLTALLLADVLYDAGLPPEMLSVVTGWPEDIGEEMITNPAIDLITFTGGVPVGKTDRRESGLPAHRAGARRQRPADHLRATCRTPTSTRRRSLRWPAPPRIPASAAPR